MRALIRVEIVDPEGRIPSRDDRGAYDAEIVSLFKSIGYDPRVPASQPRGPSSPIELELSDDISRLFEGVPDNVRVEEEKHIVMLGYTSEGQAKFVVCSINQLVIHIRVRDDLFDKLRRACREICTLIWKHEGRHHSVIAAIRRDKSVYLRVKGPVEVMEPGHGHPTILGHLIRRPVNELIKTYPRESGLAAITLLASLVLFWKTPEFAPVVASALQHLKPFQPTYIQGALERTYSALLVTFLLSGVDLLIKFRELWRGRPIVWNAGIEPTLT